MDGKSDRGCVERTLRDSEPFARSVLDSLSVNIAVLDESGTIVFVNGAWREFARANEAYGNVAEGANYLQVCESAVELGSKDAASLAEGIPDTLLRLSRVGWDPREPNQQLVDLRVAGQRAAELAEPLVESAWLACNIEGESTHLFAEAEWLQEVLLVLLGNAIKHSTAGGDIRLRIGNGAVTVEDEGAGISTVDLPHVFERFYRGKGSSEGFGLGLPICKELIERMGGSISVCSREGIGTTVKVELPKADLHAQDTDSRR